ncbi:uncharacterized protein LOC100836274 [Brachypodium distachyon]|uniref:uncharacterized protein LOC100836274 n=1 Tax=Brachypodium distachyon TaxID=15368 RepID=UPI00052FE484|nr:uncharacterized protein LOC100836274 [Brachypodium distachyon]|eukprot:XP_010238920.1 uncharacterized protein LOC100836274 [Brachypodium distachyon]
MEAIPIKDRTTLRDLADKLFMTKTTVWKRLKEGEFRRHSSDMKPTLTEDNLKARVAYALSNLEPASLPHDPTFKPAFNVVHIDEKWYYRTKTRLKCYLGPNEPIPIRHCKNKGWIEKFMFLTAVSRPRFNSAGEMIFDGKVGVWPFVELVPAQRSSKRRGKGTLEIKSCPVDQSKSREFLITKVILAIKEKWPQEDRHGTIFIQQDNAKTHVRIDDQEVNEAATSGGWDIRIVFQPPNSPDTNVLDLGYFAAIQALFQKKMPTTVDEMISKVEEAFAEYPAERSNRIFLTHQSCMREIIRQKGTIHYSVPHLKKKAMQRRGALPVVYSCEREFVDAAIAYLRTGA